MTVFVGDRLLPISWECKSQAETESVLKHTELSATMNML